LGAVVVVDFGAVVVVDFGAVVVVELGAVVVVPFGTVVVDFGAVVLVVSGGAVVFVVPFDGVVVVVVVVVAEGTTVVGAPDGSVVAVELLVPGPDTTGALDPPDGEVDTVVDATAVVVVTEVPAVPTEPLAGLPDDPLVDGDVALPVAPGTTELVWIEAATTGVAAGGCDVKCVVPTATAPAKLIETAAVRTAAMPTWASVGTLPMKGSDPSHATGPATTRTRPIDTSRNARTTIGSKCVPAQAKSSALAA
jgi:hypothetical protein